MDSSSQKKPFNRVRSPFHYIQIHLSTAIVLMLVGGSLVTLNLYSWVKYLSSESHPARTKVGFPFPAFVIVGHWHMPYGMPGTWDDTGVGLGPPEASSPFSPIKRPYPKDPLEHEVVGFIFKYDTSRRIGGGYFSYGLVALNLCFAILVLAITTFVCEGWARRKV